MARPDPSVAWPGDDDLCLDIDGVTITAVTRNHFHFQVHMQGGFGWWRTDDEVITFEPGAEDGSGVRCSHLAFGFPMMEERTLQQVFDVLEYWMLTSSPLRMLNAPHRYALLMYDEEDFLMLPVLT